MSTDARPVIVAFDGSAPAEAAVREAAALFRDRVLIVATIWEPGLAVVARPIPDTLGYSAPLPTAEQVNVVDQVQEDHAQAVAEAGVTLAREFGATADAHAVADEVNPAQTLVALAGRVDAAAIVIGSRGRGAAKARLLGSTSRRLVHESRRPVLVVRAPAD